MGFNRRKCESCAIGLLSGVEFFDFGAVLRRASWRRLENNRNPVHSLSIATMTVRVGLLGSSRVITAAVDRSAPCFNSEAVVKLRRSIAGACISVSEIVPYIAVASSGLLIGKLAALPARFIVVNNLVIVYIFDGYVSAS